MDQYAVFGNPIAHSKSPEIHALFASQTGQALEYTKQCVDEAAFAAAADAFFAGAGRGLNVTVPFKLDAFEYADELTERARLAGAVNTLAQTDSGAILGDNTDGAGMVSDIRQHLDWEIAGKKVLLMGAGGAVRGVLQPLLAEQPGLLVIANRTPAKAERLVEHFAAVTPAQTQCEARSFAELAGTQFDVVINGTSASLGGDLPPLPDTLLNSGAACYDMMYGPEPTVFLRWAQAHGCTRLADGLGMLVGQAAESFKLWRGVTPDAGPVISALRAKMTG